MAEYIDISKVDYGEGVFVNPRTKEPLPIIHKMATIEVIRDWTPRADVIERERINKAIEKIEDWNVNEAMVGCSEPFRLGVAKGLDIAVVILKKYLESQVEE